MRPQCREAAFLLGLRRSSAKQPWARVSCLRRDFRETTRVESRVSSSAVNSRRIPNEVHNSGTIQDGRPMSDDFVETFLSELEAIYKNNPSSLWCKSGFRNGKDCVIHRDHS